MWPSLKLDEKWQCPGIKQHECPLTILPVVFLAGKDVSLASKWLIYALSHFLREWYLGAVAIFFIFVAASACLDPYDFR